MSTIIQVKCTDQVLTYENTPIIASGGVKEDHIQFTFCEKWGGLTKTAVFWRSEKEVYHVMLDESDGCAVPPEVLASAGVMYFGVFGVSSEGKQRTSEVLRYNVENGAINPGTKPADPTPDIYMQVMAQFLKFEDEIRAGQADFRAEWEEYQQELSAAWEEYKTGGFYVLKDTYEADKNEINQQLSGKASKDAAGKVLNAEGSLVKIKPLIRVLKGGKLLISPPSSDLARFSPDGKKFVYIDYVNSKMYLYATETATLKSTTTLPTATCSRGLFVLNDLIVVFDTNGQAHVYRIVESNLTVSAVTTLGNLGWTNVVRPSTMQIQADDPNVFMFVGSTGSSAGSYGLSVFKIDKATLSMTKVTDLYTSAYSGNLSVVQYCDGFIMVLYRYYTKSNSLSNVFLSKITNSGTVTNTTMETITNSSYNLSGVDLENDRFIVSGYTVSYNSSSQQVYTYFFRLYSLSNLSKISEVTVGQNQHSYSYTILDGVAYYSHNAGVRDVSTGTYGQLYPLVQIIDEFNWHGNYGLMHATSVISVCEKSFGKMWVQFSNGGSLVTAIYVVDEVIDIGGVPV